MIEYLSSLQKKISRSGSRIERHAMLFALLGVFTGICSALLIVLFRLSITLSQEGLLPVAIEDYESMESPLKFLLPIAGFLLMAVFLYFFGGSFSRTGMSHVLERMQHHQGYFPSRNIMSQFVTGVIAVVSGQSAGREGAAVHLGAGLSSLVGSRLQMNHQSIRTMVACGSAAAISASFNTPLAGVIFAMEAVLMTYSVSSFIPIMLSSVSAAIISRGVFGDDVSFHVPQFELVSLWELPYLLLMSVVIGCAAAFAISIVKRTTQLTHQKSIWIRFSLAALITSIGIYFSPAIMGQGYDTVNQAALGNLTWEALLLIALCKIVVTSIVIGLGVPSGFIGPSLVMGACLGGVIGIWGDMLSPTDHSDTGLYIILGMASMMGAVLQAPLAALVAALELTGNSSGILLPSMLVIVISNLICNDLFKQSSVFQSILDVESNSHLENSLHHWLDNTPASKLAETRFQQQPRFLSRTTAENLCQKALDYILINDEQKPKALVKLSTLEFYLRFSPVGQNLEEENIDLLSIPGEKKDLAELASDSTLKEAVHLFTEKKVHALYLVSQSPNGQIFISGLLLKDDLDQYFRS